MNKMNKTVEKVWTSFTLKDKVKCVENDYSCLRSGTYGYSTPKYFCGCE